jgi:hypothetical protein
VRIKVGTLLQTPIHGTWCVDAVLDGWDLSSLVMLRPQPRYLSWRHQRCLTQRELLYGILNNLYCQVDP